MGFCFFVNIVVVIEVVKVCYGVEWVVVLDWDVYYGNGIQVIYYWCDDVLSIFLYQDGCFLFGYSGVEDIGEDCGCGFNFNVLLFFGGGYDVYMQVM